MLLDVLPEMQDGLAFELAATVVPVGRVAKLLKLPAGSLIAARAKRSASYRSALAEKTCEEIIKLSKGKGPEANAAKQMKALIEQGPRLASSTRGEPRR